MWCPEAWLSVAKCLSDANRMSVDEIERNACRAERDQTSPQEPPPGVRSVVTAKRFAPVRTPPVARAPEVPIHVVLIHRPWFIEPLLK